MEQTAQRPSVPVMKGIWGSGPIWFHNHGDKMKLRYVDAERGIVCLEASAAYVNIFRVTNEAFVDWEVRHSYLEKVRGRVSLSLAELAAAFGISWKEYPRGDGSQWLLDRFGGDCAVQGGFIRYGEFLSIPGPGTGHDGDPNVSIVINEEIKEAVRALLTNGQ